jgi:hypothetical protein
MKPILLVGLLFLVACSPYKKIVIPMSQIQTLNWMDKSEDFVTTKLGPYKAKSMNEKGYALLFDFSTYNRTPKKNNTSNNDYKVDMDFSQNRGIFPPTTYVTTSAKPGLDVNKFEIIKERVLNFYFDNNKKVMYVDAIGYPDSVRYELRKK